MKNLQKILHISNEQDAGCRYDTYVHATHRWGNSSIRSSFFTSLGRTEFDQLRYERIHTVLVSLIFFSPIKISSSWVKQAPPLAMYPVDARALKDG